MTDRDASLLDLLLRQAGGETDFKRGRGAVNFGGSLGGSTAGLSGEGLLPGDEDRLVEAL